MPVAPPSAPTYTSSRHRCHTRSLPFVLSYSYFFRHCRFFSLGPSLLHDNPTALTGCLHASLFILLPRRSSSSFYSNFLAFASLRFPLRLLAALRRLASSASRHGCSSSLYASLCAPRVFLMFLRERAFVVGIVHLRVSGRPGRRARLHSRECACRTNSLVARTQPAFRLVLPAGLPPTRTSFCRRSAESPTSSSYRGISTLFKSPFVHSFASETINKRYCMKEKSLDAYQSDAFVKPILPKGRGRFKLVKRGNLDTLANIFHSARSIYFSASLPCVRACVRACRPAARKLPFAIFPAASFREA